MEADVAWHACKQALYSPTLLRELLLSESEGMVERTLYVEPAERRDAFRRTALTA